MLAERLRARPEARVLDVCTGSGRNASALRAAGYDVSAIADTEASAIASALPPSGTFAAAISTHGLLHGTRETITANVAAIAARLEPGGLLYATFGSIRDARFNTGRRIAETTFAPLDGDERGVAHTYFTRDGLHELLRPHFIVEHLKEACVDAAAGSWAHRERPLSRAVHWYVAGRRRPAQ